jgi:hypothetical protein
VSTHTPYSLIYSTHNGDALFKKWIDHDNRMDSNGKKVKYLTIILREVDYEDEQKTDGGIVYQQILINAK